MGVGVNPFGQSDRKIPILVLHGCNIRSSHNTLATVSIVSTPERYAFFRPDTIFGFFLGTIRILILDLYKNVSLDKIGRPVQNYAYYIILSK